MESEVSNLRATRTLDPHQSDRDVQSDLSYRHYMMNMVQSRHKRAFVSPLSRDYSHSATASQSGSKWPKGSRPKKKSTQTCAAQWSMQITAPPPLPPPRRSTSPPRPSLQAWVPPPLPLGCLKFIHRGSQLKVLSCTHFTCSPEDSRGEFWRNTWIEWLMPHGWGRLFFFLSRPQSLSKIMASTDI